MVFLVFFGLFLGQPNGGLKTSRISRIVGYDSAEWKNILMIKKLCE